jgi:hypothetical protein
MPNDAKVGLVLGLGVVIAVGVIFFRKEVGAQQPAAVIQPVSPKAEASTGGGAQRPVAGWNMSRTSQSSQEKSVETNVATPDGDTPP